MNFLGKNKTNPNQTSGDTGILRGGGVLGQVNLPFC